MMMFVFYQLLYVCPFFVKHFLRCLIPSTSSYSELSVYISCVRNNLKFISNIPDMCDMSFKKII